MQVATILCMFATLVVGFIKKPVFTKETVALDNLINRYLVLDETSRPLHQLPNVNHQTLREVARNMFTGSDSFLRIHGRLPHLLPRCTENCEIFPSVELARVLGPYLAQYLSMVQPGTSLGWNMTCVNEVVKDTDACHVVVPHTWISNGYLLWQDIQRQIEPEPEDAPPHPLKWQFISISVICLLWIVCETIRLNRKAERERLERVAAELAGKEDIEGKRD